MFGADVNLAIANAHDAGTLAATQPGITLIDPVISTVLGVLAFGDSVNHGWILAAAELPLAVITASVLVLGRSAGLQPPGGQLVGACRRAGRAGGGQNGSSSAAKWLKPREGGSASP